MGEHPPDGVYERLITDALYRALESLGGERKVERRSLDPADAPHRLAAHVATELARVLSDLPSKGRPANQMALANGVLEDLAKRVPDASVQLLDERIHEGGRELLSISASESPLRPATPLSESTLLTRNRAEPALGHELSAEIASADRVDAIVAFITVGGLRAVWQSLEDLSRRGGRIRILTTTFTGTTEVAAIKRLSRLPGCEVRVSYDVRRTRLHAKAWLFSRETVLHTAYVGSANLTATALGSGREWMVKACAADLPHVIEKFGGAFESLWNDSEFEPYALGTGAEEKLSGALATATGSEARTRVLFSIRPYPYQEEILEALVAERTVHKRTRNLVVAATGTGKTVVAAFDYARRAEALGNTPRLLFLAHRREILEQAQETFRHVLKDGSFGELLAQGDKPRRWDHLFATIQSAASRELLSRFGAEHFDHVVVDECHHVPAASYQALVPNLRPGVLLGLTATPERTDGASLLPDFDGHVAAELRLWGALERQLLVPFEYYGIADQTDLRHVRWSRSGYSIDDLTSAYVDDEPRVDLIVQQLEKRVRDLREVRALAFCVSVDHAEYMARAFTERDLPALALHGESDAQARAEAPAALRDRSVNVICTCDLYNEGVDLPFVDTILLLRPTQSATLFMQQLGRGLRLHHGKDACLVLDFIGQHRREYRLDGVFGALTGIPGGKLRSAVEGGFSNVPAGCIVQLDRVASERVVASLKSHVANAVRLASELREMSTRHRPPTLAAFLEQTGRTLDDVYGKGEGWTTLKRRAGLVQGKDPEADDLSRRLGWLTHTDDPMRLRLYRRVADPSEPIADADHGPLRMLDARLTHRGILREADAVASYLRAKPTVQQELGELADVLRDRMRAVNQTFPVPEWPLALHAHYDQREILAGVGYTHPGAKSKSLQGGILKLEGKRELLFVTLDKSAASFSPTTRYRDYAISPTQFHWETQSRASVDSEAGRRYLDSSDNGWTFYLFVRESKDATYAFVGPVAYQHHSGDRPIGITWTMQHPLPASLFDRYATLAA